MDGYPFGFSPTISPDKARVPENPGLHLEKTSGSLLLKKGRKIALSDLNKELKNNLSTCHIKTNELFNINTEKAKKTFRERTQDNNKSVLFMLSQAQDNKDLQESINICNELRIQHKNSIENKDKLDFIIEEIEKRLKVLDAQESASDSPVTSTEVLLNSKNPTLLDNATASTLQNSNKKDLSTESVDQSIYPLNINFDNLQNRRLMDSDYNKLLTRVNLTRNLFVVHQLTIANVPLGTSLVEVLKNTLSERLTKRDPLNPKPDYQLLKLLTEKNYFNYPTPLRKRFVRKLEKGAATVPKASLLSKKMNAVKEKQGEYSSGFSFINKLYEFNRQSFKNSSQENNQPILDKAAECTEIIPKTINNDNTINQKNTGIKDYDLEFTVDKLLKPTVNFSKKEAEKNFSQQLKEILQKLTVHNKLYDYLTKVDPKDLVDDYLLCEKEADQYLTGEEVFKKLSSILKRIIEYELSWESRDENPCNTFPRLITLIEKVNKLLDGLKKDHQQQSSKGLSWLEDYRNKLIHSEQLAERECKKRKIVSSTIE